MKLLQKYTKYWKLWGGQITRADLGMTSLRIGTDSPTFVDCFVELVPILAQIGFGRIVELS